MKRDIGKAVYTIELQGAGKALQDLYSLDRAAQKVGKSFQSAMGGGRFNKTGGGSRPSSSGGNVVERMLASRLPGQGMVNVPSLINDKQIKAIEKALADTSRTFSTKQRETLNSALVMLKSSKDVTGATIEFLNEHVRLFDKMENATSEKLRNLRAAMTAGKADSLLFASTGAGKALQKEIDLTEIDARSQAADKRLSVMARGLERDVVARGANAAAGFQSGVMGNMRLAAIRPFADNLNDALDTGKNISAMLANFQVAERMVGSAVQYVNDLYLKRVDALQQIRIFGGEALRAEIERRDKAKERPFSAEEAADFQFTAETGKAMDIVKAIRHQGAYKDELDKVAASLKTVRDEQVRLAGVAGKDAQIQQLQIAEAHLEQMKLRLEEIQVLYQELGQSTVRLAQLQRAAAADPGNAQLKKELEEAAQAHERISAQVNQSTFDYHNLDNSLRTTAKGAKNAGFAMIQASYGAQDFIQVLAGGGGLQYALLASANNMSQVIVSSQTLSKVLGTMGVPLLAFGVTAGMLALSAWMGKTKSEAERLEDAINGVNRSFGYMEKFARSIASLNMINPMTQGSISGAFGLSQGRAEGLAGERVAPIRFSATMASLQAELEKTSGEFIRQMMDGLIELSEGGSFRKMLDSGYRGPSERRSSEMERILGFVVPAAQRGDTGALQSQLNLLKNQTWSLTDAEKEKVTKVIEEMIDAINESRVASHEYAEKIFQATRNLPTEGLTDSIIELDRSIIEAANTFKTLEEQIAAELKLAKPNAEKLAKLRNAQAMIPEISQFEQIQAMRGERGTPVQRMEMETLDQYLDRANKELTDRIKQLTERRNAAENPEAKAEIDAAIKRAQQQQTNLNALLPQQKQNALRRAQLAASENVIAKQMHSITEGTQAAVEAARKDFEGPELTRMLADIQAADQKARLDVIQGEKGTPVQRMEMETLDAYLARADKELNDRIANMTAQLAVSSNPVERASLGVAIQRAQQQRGMLSTNVAQQQANMQARAALGARNDILGLEIQGIQERAQQEREAAQRDLSGQARTQAIADINAAEAAAIDRASKAFSNRQQDTLAGFQGQILGAMGTPEARMGAENLNLVGQFREIQSMLDAGLVDATMAQDMLDMATAVSEQRKKDIEFENKKAGFSDIGSLWKQIQMSLKPDKSTQLQQQSVNILTAIQNRLAQGLSLTIP